MIVYGFCTCFGCLFQTGNIYFFLLCNYFLNLVLNNNEQRFNIVFDLIPYIWLLVKLYSLFRLSIYPLGKIKIRLNVAYQLSSNESWLIDWVSLYLCIPRLVINLIILILLVTPTLKLSRYLTTSPAILQGGKVKLELISCVWKS